MIFPFIDMFHSFVWCNNALFIQYVALFQTLPRGLLEAHTEAVKPESVRKNKYKDIIACKYNNRYR